MSDILPFLRYSHFVFTFVVNLVVYDSWLVFTIESVLYFDAYFVVRKLPTQLRPGVEIISHQYEYGCFFTISRWAADRHRARMYRGLLELEGSLVACIVGAPNNFGYATAGSYLRYMQVISDELAGAFTMCQKMGFLVNCDSAPMRLFPDDIVRGWAPISKWKFISIANINASRYEVDAIRISHLSRGLEYGRRRTPIASYS